MLSTHVTCIETSAVHAVGIISDKDQVTSHMENGKTEFYSFTSTARGYHVYRRVWNARIGE